MKINPGFLYENYQSLLLDVDLSIIMIEIFCQVFIEVNEDIENDQSFFFLSKIIYLTLYEGLPNENVLRGSTFKSVYMTYSLTLKTRIFVLKISLNPY
jgi:hypothetical protein